MNLEAVLERYPKKAKLANGLVATLRPLAAKDQKAFHQFYLALPPQDLMFLKVRATDPAVIKEWCRKIDYYRNLPLLAWNEKEIIGVCTLHQRNGGWKRHIGRLNVHTHPKYRGIGVARTLLNEIISVARDASLEYLEAEFFGRQENAIKMFGLLGFGKLYSLPDYVKDMQAIKHDYILMGMKLTTEEEYAGMG